jgi:hypothetical protein
MPINVQQASQNWVQGASSQLANQKYAQNTSGKGQLQKERSAQAENSYAAGVQAAVQNGTRLRAVQAQDPSKYERMIQAKGIQNRAAGVQAVGANGWAAGFSPYAPIIDQVVAGLPAKTPDGVQNVMNRTVPLVQALQNAKRGGANTGAVSTGFQASGSRGMFL